MLDRLPHRLRRALELRYLESAPAADAAEELQASVPAFHKLCERARRLARQRSKDFLS
jgi:DNA-directed RNA polymerase specialized sigma24 family protein